MEHKEFNYRNLEDLKKECERLGVRLNFSTNMKLFERKVNINGLVTPNSIAFHPMEGCDGTKEGSPAELTMRRYQRFAKGGPGLIWVEAVAAVREGRANPKQLWIHKENIEEFKKLHKTIISSAQEEFGQNFRPVTIVQLTHSGRFSKPNNDFEPIIAHQDPYINARYKNENIAHIITDEELEQLEDQFVEAALLVKEAGFDGVDIKACHRYLSSELLSAFDRQGKYGGSFEGRTRFIINTIDKVKKAVGEDFIIASRMNIYDGIQYPYGWGVDKDNPLIADFTEPKKLISMLYDRGVRLLNLTMGTPYYNPHVNRPYDKGGYVPPEHPLEGISRLMNGIGTMQKEFSNMVIVGTGFSYLREFSANLGAGVLENSQATLIGYGRAAFAYPDLVKDILIKGQMDRRKCCITCGKCSEIMRVNGTTGCVIKDAKIYGPIYREYIG